MSEKNGFPVFFEVLLSP